MIDALTYQEMLKHIKGNVERYGIKEDSIGILITRPDLDTGKSIMNSLEYFHFRTGKSINFYLPGYGAYWNDTYPDGAEVCEINGVKWSFSNEMFIDFVCDLEKYSKWIYSGESELLLVDLKDGIVSYDKMMLFHLDNMIRDKVIYSVHQFFEQIFRICKDKETLTQVSDAFALDQGKQITRELILKSLPAGLGTVFTKEKYFCVRNLDN